MISLIVAVSSNGVIGKENKLPWGKLPADMKHFRDKTLGKTVLMGRKTYESIGKPLEGRTNIVLSRSTLESGAKYFFESDKDLIVTQELDVIYKFAKAGEVVIIGGEEIYKQFANMADIIYLTEINGIFKGDAYFSCVLDFREWDEVETNFRPRDSENPYDMTFRTLKRNV